MRGYQKGLESVAHLLNALEKSGKLAAGESLLVGRLLKDLKRAIDTKNEKLLRKTINKICEIFVGKLED